MLSVELLLACLLSFAVALPVLAAPHFQFVAHETRGTVPAGFVKNSAAPGDSLLSLRIGLVQGDPEGLQKELYAVSTPTSPRYRQHLSAAEAISYLAPKPESAKAVTDWLSANGIATQPASVAGDWLSFSTTVSKANELLNANFTVFTHVDSGTVAVRAMNYSIPAHLKGHLDFVHPTISFPHVSMDTVPASRPIASPPLAPASAVSRDAVPASCATLITPDCLQALYGIPSSSTTPERDLGHLVVLGYGSEYPQHLDLRSFLTQYRPDVPNNTTWLLDSLDPGPVDPQSISGTNDEANLDAQYTIGLAPGVPTTFLSVPVGDPSGFQTAINWALTSPDAASLHTMTTSYDWNEEDLSETVANNLCNGYASLGARGISVLFSSGDGGVGGKQGGKTCTTFVPTFPGSCPFVTTVGATTGVPERAAALSGGGFSNYFAMPAYQAASVSNYLSALGGTYSHLFARAGRAYPDISAQGQNFAYYNGEDMHTIDGTSASSPTVASIVAMLNEELIAAGKKPMGFLNPWLYSSASSALNDITTGNNPGCGTNGFSATIGWDPVTGLGTPNYSRLKAAAGL